MQASDVFEAACGVDSLGDNNAVVKVQTEFIGKNDLEVAETDHIDMDNPVVEIHQNARLTLVNLKFEDENDSDFVYLSDMVKKFQTIENSMDSDKTPSISITILPKDIQGFFIHGVSGVGILQSSAPNKGFDTVSLVFTNDCIHAYAMDLDKIDSDKLESDAFMEEHFGQP